MKKTYNDMLYLVSCGINCIVPDRERICETDIEELFDLSAAHMLEVLVGTALKRCGVILPDNWTQKLSKSTRKVILFENEKKKLFDFLEQNNIWYLPMKGSILQPYYPEIGMRQMSDIDILFDETRCDEVREFMKAQGYTTESFGKGVHDDYQKAPVYNFELHRRLFDSVRQPELSAYYDDVRSGLILCDGSSFRYRFTAEDFYIYLLAHAYKHYTIGGTGLRTLLDFYVYLSAEESNMDLEYIRRECKTLRLDEFERQSRTLCKKIFDLKAIDDFCDLENRLSDEEIEMLEYYLSSGTYGTAERSVTNSIKKYKCEKGSVSRIGYIFHRIFPPAESYKSEFPFFYKHKWLLPVVWLYRMLRMFFTPKRRKAILREIKIINNTNP